MWIRMKTFRLHTVKQNEDIWIMQAGTEWLLMDNAIRSGIIKEPEVYYSRTHISCYFQVKNYYLTDIGKYLWRMNKIRRYLLLQSNSMVVKKHVSEQKNMIWLVVQWLLWEISLCCKKNISITQPLHEI